MRGTVIVCIFSFQLFLYFSVYRLFVGGYWPIRIVSIRLIEENKNFENIISTLYYLDFIISGGEMHWKTRLKPINKQMTLILRHLFDATISKKKNVIKYHKYIHSTFDSFVKQKTSLKLNYGMLQATNPDFVDLFMNPRLKFDAAQDIASIESIVKSPDCGMPMNLPKQEVLNIFVNVEELTLTLLPIQPSKIYPIPLLSLLSIIKSHPAMEMVSLMLGSGWSRYISAIDSVYASSLEMNMKSKYENAGYDIHLEEQDRQMYCVIKRKS